MIKILVSKLLGSSHIRKRVRTCLQELSFPHIGDSLLSLVCDSCLNLVLVAGSTKYKFPLIPDSCPAICVVSRNRSCREVARQYSCLVCLPHPQTSNAWAYYLTQPTVIKAALLKELISCSSAGPIEDAAVWEAELEEEEERASRFQVRLMS